MANARDVRSDFFRGKLATLAGFRTLRHFDFEFLSVNQVVGSHSEPSRSDLLNFVSGLRFVDPKIGIFAAFTGITSAAELIHSESERAVSFWTKGTKRHGLRAELFQNVLCG